MIDLKSLSANVKGTQLYEFLDEVKLNVADIRNTLNVKPEIELEVRKALCDIIEEMIIQRLKTADNKVEKNTDNWK